MRVERFELSATAWKAVNLTINRYPQNIFFNLSIHLSIIFFTLIYNSKNRTPIFKIRIIYLKFKVIIRISIKESIN